MGAYWLHVEAELSTAAEAAKPNGFCHKSGEPAVREAEAVCLTTGWRLWGQLPVVRRDSVVSCLADACSGVAAACVSLLLGPAKRCRRCIASVLCL